ncbi:hypothetical protein QTP70_008659 [Hemibagrus guttatus]|uniref:C-type lectin domain-containing protein n=1 Tax=Hemibagrus guttatus TaxID=175788 RepID=A0AAE0ULR5_9TELE|nr:hypothetical protein QTP70_008659 [Hemibagrus guttatus]
MPHWEEAPGKTQDTLERLCLSAGLGTPRGPSGRAGGNVWGEGDKLIMIKKNLTWKEALRYCRKHHHDLYSVCTEKMQFWVKEMSQNASTEHVGLGLHHTCSLGFWCESSNRTRVRTKSGPNKRTETCLKKWFRYAFKQTLERFVCERRLTSFGGGCPQSDLLLPPRLRRDSLRLTPHRQRRSPATPPSLPPLGGFRPSRAEVVARLYYASGDVARLCCSAVDVAWLCCSAVDVAWLS